MLPFGFFRRTPPNPQIAAGLFAAKGKGSDWGLTVSYRSSETATPAPATPPGLDGQGQKAVSMCPIGSPFGPIEIVSPTSKKELRPRD